MAKAKKQVRSNDSSGILSTPVLFKELPTKKFEKTSKYVEALVNVKKKGFWYLIGKFDKSTSANGAAAWLRKNPALLDGKYDFATRTVDNQTGLFAMLLK